MPARLDAPVDVAGTTFAMPLLLPATQNGPARRQSTADPAPADIATEPGLKLIDRMIRWAALVQLRRSMGLWGARVNSFRASRVLRLSLGLAFVVPLLCGVTSAYADADPGGPGPGPSRAASSGDVSPAAPAAQLARAATATPAAASTMAGYIYRDLNDNGAFDKGEGFGKVTLTLDSESSNVNATLTTTSASSGAFTFTHVPAGAYYLSGQAPGGWNVIPQFVRTGATQASQLRVRAVRPLNGALHATLKFDKHVYRVGERAHVTITLRNSGKIALRGITAECNHVGDPDQLAAVEPAWGALATDGAGVTVQPGQILTTHVSTSVPQAARNFGSFIAACDFGYSNVEEADRPHTRDQALVPGGFGAVNVQVAGFANGLQGPGVPSPNVRLALINAAGCPFLLRGITNAAGMYTFGHVPAGQVALYVYPQAGWKMPPPNPTDAFVLSPTTSHEIIQLIPGTAPLPPTPTPPSTNCDAASTTPSSPAGPPAALAATGTSDGPLLAIGLALTIAGVGLTALGLRRRTI